MRLARKLFLLATMAIAALAMTAGSANAQVTITGESPSQACPTLNVNGHNVTGGCHVEFESTEEVPLVAYVPDPLIVSNCEVHLEARLATNGEGYVTAASLVNHEEAEIPCTRRPCQEVDQQPHEMIPWPIHIREASGDESVEATFCLEPLAAPEGTNQGSCTVHLEINNLGGHNYEIGHSEPNPNNEAFCEGATMPPVSIRHAHFVYEEDTTERIEIAH